MGKDVKGVFGDVTYRFGEFDEFIQFLVVYDRNKMQHKRHILCTSVLKMLCAVWSCSVSPLMWSRRCLPFVTNPKSFSILWWPALPLQILSQMHILLSITVIHLGVDVWGVAWENMPNSWWFGSKQIQLGLSILYQEVCLSCVDNRDVTSGIFFAHVF